MKEEEGRDAVRKKAREKKGGGQREHKKSARQKRKKTDFRSCVKVEVAVLGSLVPNKPFGFC